MGNKEVIVDTCFLQKLSKDGRNIDNIKVILGELGYTPVIHPYLAENEVLDNRIQALISSGYIRKIEYDEFIDDSYSKQMYESYFITIYKDLRGLLDATKPYKSEKMYEEISNVDLYNSHRQGCSLGDVHMILMALFLGMPIILTEDSDIDALRIIAERRTKLGDVKVEILNIVDLIKKIAGNPDATVKKKNLINILEQTQYKAFKYQINEIWNESHRVFNLNL